MAYKNEAAFSRALSEALRKQGAIVTRIETGGTSQGVPDMFVQTNGGDVWLELKNIPNLDDEAIERKGFIKVPWRPGQAAWGYNYWRMHSKKKFTLTVVAGKNKFYVIKMDCLYLKNEAPISCMLSCWCMPSLVDEIGKIAGGVA